MLALSCASLTIVVMAAGQPAGPIPVDLAVAGTITPIASTALAEAARVWARYGVSVHPAGGGGSHGGVLVHVRIADGAAPASRDAAALGTITFHDGVPDPEITLFEGRAWSLICTAATTAEHWPISYRELLMGRVLGRALAHELGHFILQARTHSASGLMRASQSIADLMAPDAAALSLSSADVAALPAALQRLRQ
jgi:hypothetical protein